MANTPGEMTGMLHIPHTGAGGVFEGESGTSGLPQFVVLDDGKFTELEGALAVDHAARTLRYFRNETEYAPALSPPAVSFERTPERFYKYRNPTSTTQWHYMGAGEPVEVQERAGGVNLWRFYDKVKHYDGKEDEHTYGTLTQTVTVWDFKWEFTLKYTDFNPYRTPVVGSLRVSADTTRVADAYREVTINKWGSDPNDVHYLIQTYVQGHVRGVWLNGDVQVGWIDNPSSYTREVTAVYAREYGPPEQGSKVIATYVDCWMGIASLEQQWQAYRPQGATPLMDWVDIRAPGGYYRKYLPVAYVTRHAPEKPEKTLRDVEYSKWGKLPEPNKVVFSALGGLVKVEGPRSTELGRLEDDYLQTTATLTAFKHTFTGGTWAALRDTPLVREDGTTDWERVIVLHASDTTVTAVRQDGSTEAIPREQFEREILRVSPGAFTGFSSVGTLNNTWPPQWAWCVCGRDTRAVAVHDAWRDSQKTRPQPDAVPPPGPDHWYWPARPGKRPRKAPSTAPVAPLGLTLADVTGEVLHDEPLKRREPPLLLPAEAKTGAALNVDVRAKVAKRILYQPSEWPEELDDRTSVTGMLRLIFHIPTVQSGEKVRAALVLRLKTKAETVRVNGVECSLFKLGHNADQRRGWHSYVVPVPTSSAGVYGLEFEGQCSRALLCVRVMPVESSPLPA